MSGLAPFDTLYDATAGQAVPLPSELAALYGPLRLPACPDRPTTLANFVTTLDGVVSLGISGQAGGGPISGEAPHDRALMGLLRAVADAVVVGAGTLRAVPRHVSPSLAPDYQALRDSLGKPAPPLTVIVTASGAIDPGWPVFTSGAAPVLIVTTARGADGIRQQPLRAAVRVADVQGAGTIGAETILAAIGAERPARVVLAEGGPRRFGDFLAGQAIDALFLTLAPQVAGRSETNLRPSLDAGWGFGPEHPLWSTLVAVKRADSHLFLRYAFPPDGGSLAVGDRPIVSSRNPPSSRTEFELEPLPPFRLDLTAWALRRRPDNLMDRWDGTTYRRVLLLDGRATALAVTQVGPLDVPRLRVVLEGPTEGADRVSQATIALDRLLGLRVDLAGFYALAERDPKLGPLAERFRGLKPPRFPHPFEALENAIACQQITLTQGIRLLDRLAEARGPGVSPTFHALPGPADVAPVPLETLRDLGLSRQKARALVEAAGAVVDGRLDFDALKRLDDAAVVARLRELPGVGRWTAEYVLLRGFGRTHVFPGDDVGARKNLARWLGRPSPLDYDGVRRAVAPWSPYAGLVYFHLLLERLAERGDVTETDGADSATSGDETSR